jgi:uncharacterized protein (DUF1684 family)
MLRIFLSLVFGASICDAAISAVNANITAGVEQWRAERLASLTAPEGWLSLVALKWLNPGPNTVGSAPDNSVVIPVGPQHLGKVTWGGDGKVTIEPTIDSEVLINGKKSESSILVDDSNENPTRVSFGTALFYLVDRAGKKGLRIKDSKASTRTQFVGLDYFPIDLSWHVEAKWVPFETPKEIEVASIIGTKERARIAGKAVFERDGRSYELIPIEESPDSLFFVFADKTSGKETYGAARFLNADLPKDGKVLLDFNCAFNPPCAFTTFATCPLPPPGNRLDVAITAGEKKYRGEPEE